MDALFIHPNASSKIYQDLSKDFSAIEPPIWAGMLAQHCRTKGFHVDILDCEAMQFTDEKAVHVIQSLSPKLACFVVYGQQPSASTQNMEGATSLSALLRKHCPEIKILFVGGHISALPIDTLAAHPEIDFVCLNEGVYAISELLQNNLNADFVPGICSRFTHIGVRMHSVPTIVPKEKLEEDLPGVAWDLLPMSKYRTALWHSYTNNCDRGKFASIYTSLGCPYSCSFCMINSPFGKSSFRHWPVEHTINELKKLKSLGVVNLKIADEMFVLNPNHFLEICKRIVEEGMEFNIWCYARVDTIKPQYLETMRKAGIRWIGLGIESGVQRVRKDVIKGKFEEVDIKSIVAMVRQHDINVAANYIFGLPADTQESMQATLDLAIELNTEMANFYSCMAYPGSQIHDDAKNNPDILPDSYVGYSQHSYECKPLANKNLSAAEILNFRDRAWYTYHSRKEHIDLIESKFGSDAANNLKESIKIQLPRKILGD